LRALTRKYNRKYKLKNVIEFAIELHINRMHYTIQSINVYLVSYGIRNQNCLSLKSVTLSEREMLKWNVVVKCVCGRWKGRNINKRLFERNAVEIVS